MTSTDWRTNIHGLPTWVFALVVIYCTANFGSCQQNWAPWHDFEKNVVAETHYGYVRGFSIPWHVDDERFDPEHDVEPLWFTRRISVFLGIPYAEPPVGRRRFKAR